MGHTLTLDVPEDVYHTLRQQAEQAGQLPETLAVQLLTAATQPPADDPLEPFIGALSSHGSDWADRHDTHLGKSLRGTMDRRAHKGGSDA